MFAHALSFLFNCFDLLTAAYDVELELLIYIHVGEEDGQLKEISAPRAALTAVRT